MSPNVPSRAARELKSRQEERASANLLEVPDPDVSEEELELIEARLNAATDGPWEPFVEGRDHVAGDDFIRTGGGMNDEAPDMYVQLAFPDRPGVVPAPTADLDFIAHARQDIRRLIDEVRRLRDQLGSE